MYRLTGPKIDLELTEQETRRLISACVVELMRKKNDLRDPGLYPVEEELIRKIELSRACKDSL